LLYRGDVREVRLLGLAEDGEHIVLTGPEVGTLHLRVDDRLKAAVLGDRHLLDQLAARVQSSLSPREIQARLRAGETAEEVAASAGVPVERVRRFEGPVMDEREHAARAARDAEVRGRNATLSDLVDALVGTTEPEPPRWDATRHADGPWTIRVEYVSGHLPQVAEWSWDPGRRLLAPLDARAEALMAEPSSTSAAGVTLSVVREGPRAASVPPIALPHEERRNGPTDSEAEADGIAPGKRASVPSWDDILFGTRPPDS
jgi:hypothetical protein